MKGTAMNDWLKRLRLEINYHNGLCPHCMDEGNFAAAQPTIANVRKDHFAFCTKHRLYWKVGSNLYSGWVYESESTWTENRQMLASMQCVEPRFRLDE
jgi:hypothetical protein